MLHAYRRLLFAIVTCLGLLGCSVDAQTLTVPAPDAAEFESTVYPLLLRDCGFPACHGNPARFFRVFGPGRTRLAPEMGLFEPATADELMHSYDRARSMLANTGDVRGSLILRKPLDESAGGGMHEGTDNWGRDVYGTSDAVGYQVLEAWALSTRGSEP
jgi:hypothetical protein